MRFKIFIILISISACLLASGCPAPCEIEDREVKAVHTDAAPVVQALENFRKDEKKYPRALNELAPRYLDKIPERLGERKFSYSLVSSDNYNLRIYSPSGGSYSGSCSYSEIEEQWKRLNQP